MIYHMTEILRPRGHSILRFAPFQEPLKLQLHVQEQRMILWPKNILLNYMSRLHQDQKQVFFWKSNLLSNTNMRGYYFGIDPSNQHRYHGYWNPNYNGIKSTGDSRLAYDEIFNLTVHVNYETYTTYVNGIVHYTSPRMDGSFTSNHAGVYGYASNAIFHSFRIIIPNGVERFCSAYVYDKTNRHCYGYYRDDYTTLETSLSPDTQYDAAIRYDTATCAPTTTTSSPTKNTAEPTKTPSSSHTVTPTTTSHPTLNPSITPFTLAPQSTPTEAQTPAPSFTTQPTSYPTLPPDTSHTNTMTSSGTISPLITSQILDIFVTTSTDNIHDDEVRQGMDNGYLLITILLIGAGVIAFCICLILCLLCFLRGKRKERMESMNWEATTVHVTCETTTSDEHINELRKKIGKLRTRGQEGTTCHHVTSLSRSVKQQDMCASDTNVVRLYHDTDEDDMLPGINTLNANAIHHDDVVMAGNTLGEGDAFDVPAGPPPPPPLQNNMNAREPMGFVHAAADDEVIVGDDETDIGATVQ
eukprot:313113_1